MKLPIHLALGYKNKSQIARVTTEPWVSKNLYCPSCAKFGLQATPPNTRVVDFICKVCHEQFQLKSKARKISTSLKGADYQATLFAIKEKVNPSLIVLIYCPVRYFVIDVTVIHRFGIRESSIRACKPLGAHTRRAGNWQGCDYRIKKIRRKYFIPVVRKSNARLKFSVSKKFQMVTRNSFRTTR